MIFSITRNRMVAFLLAFGILILGSGELPSYATEAVLNTQKEITPVTIHAESGKGSTIIVPIYMKGKLVREYIISPRDARGGLQRIFDWIHWYHTAMKDDTAFTVKLPRATYVLHKVSKDEMTSYHKSNNASLGIPVGYLALYSGTTLDLTSGAVLKLDKDQREFCLMRFGRGNETAQGYDTFENIKILGGTFDGQRTKHPLLRFCHAKNITVSGIKFTNIYKQHHFEFAGCKNIVVDGCIFDKYLSNNYGSSNNHEALQIDVLTPSAFPVAGVDGYDGTMNRGIVVKNCIFKHCKRGIGTHTGIVGLYHNDVTIKNNTFTDTIGYSIATINWRHSRITGNKMSGGRGIYIRHMSGENHRKYNPNIFTKDGRVETNMDMIVENNTIKTMATEEDKAFFGIATYGELVKKPFQGLNSRGLTTYTDVDGTVKEYENVPAGDYRVKNLKILNNTILIQGKATGIKMIGAVYCKVSDNSIKNLIKGQEGEAGIRDYSGTGNVYTGNVIKDCKRSLASGIILRSCTKTKITENTIIRTRGKGILSVTPNLGSKLTAILPGVEYFGSENNDKAARNRIFDNKFIGCGGKVQRNKKT